MKVRDNAQVTAEEWDFVRGKTTDEPFTDSPADKLPLPLPAELEEFGKVWYLVMQTFVNTCLYSRTSRWPWTASSARRKCPLVQITCTTSVQSTLTRIVLFA